jgi:purine-binding chemotaxis protein CheW
MSETKNETQQLVAFFLANEEYGVPIIQVQEVIRKPDITRIPGMPDFVDGVINLRGKIIPIIDLRKRFGLAQTDDSDKTRIIVTKATDQILGLVVDGVSEVVHLMKEQVEPIPASIAAIDAEYLSGVGKFDKRIIILLNLEKLLTDLEKASIEQLNKKEKAFDKNTNSELTPNDHKGGK